MSLISNLIQQGWLKTPHIIEAFKAVHRKDFLPQNLQDLAELNEPLPIGFEQTISQPLVVAFMLELLQPKPGDRILDIGAGSGWTTALLAYCVSQEGNPKSKMINPCPQMLRIKRCRRAKQIPARLVSQRKAGRQNLNVQNSKGKVIAIERISKLKNFAEQNVVKYNFVKKGIIKFICGDGAKGYVQEAPFDKILGSASAEKMPLAWQEQLKVGGRIVSPVKTSVWLFTKKSASEFDKKEFPGFAFVPLVGGL